jgi:capsular polysaccharide biosynthesis protein
MSAPTVPQALAAALPASVSAPDRDWLASLAAARSAGKTVRPVEALRAKRLLAAHLPPDEGFEVLRGVLGLDDAISLRRRPIAGLFDALREAGRIVAMFHEAGPSFTCRAPRVVGPGRIPPLTGRPRNVFAGVLPRATVYARSAAILQGDRMIFDIQPGELHAVPSELAFDPMVFRREGESVLALDDRAPAREIALDRAWSLMGINSLHFGHWSIEYLAQFLTARDLPGFAAAPVLIDAGMPPQHRESLEALAPPGLRLIEVAPGMRVRVGQLQVVANWAYCPHHILTDHGSWDPSVFVGAFDKAAAVYRAAGAELERRHGALASSGLFWARDNTRHRGIANHPEVTALLAARGFAPHLPETLPFVEQVARLRGADRIVVQNGSALHGLLFGRPGTRVCYLSHPALPLFALVHEALAQLDQQVTVLTGPMTAPAPGYVERSGYEIPLDRLGGFLDNWA